MQNPEQIIAWQQALLDSADLTIISTDLDGTIRSCNAGALQRLGYTAEELIGKTTPQLIHDQAEIEQRAHELSRELGRPIAPGIETFVAKTLLGLPDENEWTYIRKDGSRFPVALSVTAMRDARGEVVGYLGVGRDLSTLKRTQGELREKEALLSLISSFSPAPTVISSALDGRILNVNDSFLRFFGYKKDEVIGHTSLELGLYGDLKRREELIQLFKTQGYLSDVEAEVRTKSGESRFISISTRTAIFEGQECFCSILLDITERLQTVKALRESEERFKSAFDFAANGKALVAPDGRFLQVNAAFCEITGYAENELLTRDFQSITHPDDLELDLNSAAQMYRGETRSFQLEKRYLHKNGHAVWILLSASVVRDAQGEPLYAIAQVQDISARKEAEENLRKSQEALRRNEKLLRTVLDLLPVGVWTADSEGVIRTSNPAGRAIWGGDRLVGVEKFGEYKGWRSETGELIAARDWALARAVLDGQTTLEETIDIESFDGQRKTILNSALPMRGEQNEITGAIVVVQDITARRQAEEQIRQLNQELEQRVMERTAELWAANGRLQDAMQEAQRATKAKSEFLSRASHELRTPLNAILGFAQLLEQEELTGSTHECVTQILRGGEHLLRLINEILDIARVESGRLRVNLQTVNLSDIIPEMAQLLSPLATRREINVHIQASDPTALAFADPQLLKQVLMNLLTNAVKYNRPHGEVTVKWELRDASWWRCTVQDTGPGICRENLGKLFQPFERLNAPLTGESGTGLGLLLCRNLMQAMQGHIGVDSEVGLGSRFWIELPAARDLYQ